MAPLPSGSVTHRRTCLAVLVLVILGACSSSDTTATIEPAVDTTAIVAAEPPVPTTAASTTVPTTTEAPATTAAPTTTEVAHTGGAQSCAADKVLVDADGDGWGGCVTPTTTTVDDGAPSANQGDFNVLFIGAAIEAREQVDIATALEDAVYSVDSVDLLEFYTEDGVPRPELRIAVTTGYSGIEYRDETAWAIAKGLEFLWEDGDSMLFRNDDGTLITSLVLTVDTTRYVAPYEMMTMVADLQILSADWLNLARQPG